ncbi:MAG: hypothetical protein ACRD4X_15550 [Candidatus Acidiferrales bacterium]
MQYLIVDYGMPKPYGKFIWSPKIEGATSFSSSDEADSCKNSVPDATGVIATGGKWCVIKDSK